MKLTKAQREVLENIARKGDKGYPESAYLFSGAKGRVVTALRNSGLVVRRPDPSPRIMTDRLHLTPAGRSALENR